MKIDTILIISLLVFVSCNESKINETTTETQEEVQNSDANGSEILSKDLEQSMEQLGDLFNMGAEAESGGDALPEVEALQKLLEMSGMEDQGTSEAFQELLTKDMSSSELLSAKVILDLLEESGVSREEMQKLLNNPDSLKLLAQEAIKQRRLDQVEQKGKLPKGKLSREQLTSTNTPTGVSLQEAILLVQAESGPEATMVKLKKIDSLAGTNIMEQLDLTEAGYLMNSVKKDNEMPASESEKEKMETLRKLAGQLHSDKEATELLTQLQQTEADIVSGKLKVSPQYQRTIEHQRKTVNIFKKDFDRKAIAAKKKFKQLNPDLYFGEEAGQTYVGHMKKAVYLPLGKLSFADKVVQAKHPQLLTQQKNNVLGEPDVIKGFLAEDISGIHSLGLGGSLTIRFVDNALTNVNGPDLYIFEIGQIEPTNLEISKDNKTWIKVGKIDGGVSEVDISPFVKQGELFYYVRLTDLKMDSALPGADVDAIAAIGAAMRLNLDSKVLFKTGKSALKPEGITALKVLAESIAVLKKGTIIVEGHTDDVGSAENNQKLSLARAKSVSKELKKLLPSSNFKWKEKGFGESKPLVANDSDENRTKNRRVEVLVIPN